MDIRNFFKPKNEGSSPSAGKSPAPAVKKRSRKRMLIDSDSDEEPIKTQKNKSPDSSSRNSSVKKKVANAPSKYREVDSTAVKSLFGTEPVKQVAALKRKNEKTVGEKELADVSSAFLEIDDDAWIQDVASPVKQVVCRKEGNEKVTTQKKSESDSPRKKRQCLAGSVVPLESTSSASTERDNSPLNSPSKKTSTVTTDHRMSPELETPEVAKSVKPNALTSKSPNSLNTAINGNGLPKSRIIENEMCNPRVTIPNKSPKLSQPCNPASSTVASPRKKIEKTESELWVDKYKPTTLKQIIGQQGDKSNVRKLVHWLKNWYSNHSGNKKIPRPSPWAKDNDGAYFKAALLSGPPGVGKTTTAQLVCKDLQMDTVEFNASDTRSKKLLNEQITELLGSQSISPFFTGGASTSKHHVLLMDEVDGMAGNEDRGGMQELISLIKNSKVPVICMCNDRNHPKIRSLVNYCFDLRFSKPRADQIKSAMMSICFKEGIKIKPDALNDIITSANQDIRLILNHLSMLAAKKDAQMMVTTKELKLGAWDVLRKIFSETERSTMSIHDKLDLFFHDYSIAPLFVHENYLNVVPHCPTSKGKKEKMNLFAKAASSLCHGDFVDQAIRSRNAWSLLPTQAMFSTLIPGEALQGHVGGMINFPAWLGKNSKKNKMDRLAQEIQSHTRLKASASKEAIRLDYGQVFRDTLLRPLSTNGNEGIPESLSIMKEYSFLREDIQSLNELSLWPGAKDPLASIDSKVKAAFTRAYNKNPILTPFSVSAAGVKKNKSGAGDELEFDDDGDEDIEDEDQDDPLADGMIKTKTKTAKSEKEAKKPAASGSSDRKPRGRGRGVKR